MEGGPGGTRERLPSVQAVTHWQRTRGGGSERVLAGPKGGNNHRARELARKGKRV